MSLATASSSFINVVNAKKRKEHERETVTKKDK
jgi:hypothetical protein